MKSYPGKLQWGNVSFVGKGGPRKNNTPVTPPDSGKQPLRDEYIKRRISESTLNRLCSRLIHWQVFLNAESFSLATCHISFSTWIVTPVLSLHVFLSCVIDLLTSWPNCISSHGDFLIYRRIPETFNKLLLCDNVFDLIGSRWATDTARTFPHVQQSQGQLAPRWVHYPR